MSASRVSDQSDSNPELRQEAAEERRSGTDEAAPGPSAPTVADGTPMTSHGAGQNVLDWVRGNPFAHCTTVACWWGAIAATGPHVLHYLAPMAVTGLVAGAGGRLLFGVLGFVATIPTLWRLRRRTGNWRAPGLVLVAFFVIFMLSTLLAGTIFGKVTGDDILPATQPVDTDPNHLHG